MKTLRLVSTPTRNRRLNEIIGLTVLVGAALLLLALVSYIIRKLHKPTCIIHEVENFSRRHIHYTVHDEQFIRAGRSLLDIIAICLGEKWNRDIEQAWLNCYITLAEALMNASKTYNQEPVYYC